MLVRRARIVAFLIFGLSGGADANQEGKDMELEDMGFACAGRYAGQIERSGGCRRTLFLHTKGGRRYYLYADLDYCNACSSATNCGEELPGPGAPRRKRRCRSAPANRPSPAR